MKKLILFFLLFAHFSFGISVTIVTQQDVYDDYLKFINNRNPFTLNLGYVPVGCGIYFSGVARTDIEALDILLFQKNLRMVKLFIMHLIKD